MLVCLVDGGGQREGGISKMDVGGKRGGGGLREGK